MPSMKANRVNLRPLQMCVSVFILAKKQKFLYINVFIRKMRSSFGINGFYLICIIKKIFCKIFEYNKTLQCSIFFNHKVAPAPLQRTSL